MTISPEQLEAYTALAYDAKAPSDRVAKYADLPEEVKRWERRGVLALLEAVNYVAEKVGRND